MKRLLIVLVIAILVGMLARGSSAGVCIETNGEVVCDIPPVSPLVSENKVFLPYLAN